MARKKLSTLARGLPGVHLGILEGNQYRHVAFLDGRNRVLFSASPDDLFDADGNRFEDDLP